MKNLIILLVIICLPILLSAQIGNFSYENLFFEDHKIENQESAINNNWRLDSTLFYNNWGNPLNLEFKNIYTYSSQGLIDKKNEYYYLTIDSVLYERECDYTYRDTEHIDKVIIYVILDSNRITSNRRNYIYTNNNVVRNLEAWNTLFTNWNLIDNHILVYNISNQVIQRTYYDVQFDYRYDNNGNLKQIVHSDLDTATMQFDSSGVYDITYNNQGQMESILETYSVGSQLRYKDLNFTYDNQGRIEEEIYRNLLSSGWSNWYRILHVYDSNGNKIEESSYYATVPTGWEIYDKKEFYYSSIVNTNFIKNEINLKYYPNPTVDIINIELPKDTRNSNAQLFDINGRLLKNYIFNKEIEQINISNLSNGYYFLKIKNNNYESTLKIMKQ